MPTLETGDLPERDPQSNDAIAALAWIVARKFAGQIEIDTREMQSSGCRLNLRWKLGSDCETILIVSASFWPINEAER